MISPMLLVVDYDVHVGSVPARHYDTITLLSFLGSLLYHASYKPVWTLWLTYVCIDSTCEVSFDNSIMTMTNPVTQRETDGVESDVDVVL